MCQMYQLIFFAGHLKMIIIYIGSDEGKRTDE
jgi:hypothetical protein